MYSSSNLVIIIRLEYKLQYVIHISGHIFMTIGRDSVLDLHILSDSLFRYQIFAILSFGQCS